jgi:hypothetical protein
MDPIVKCLVAPWLAVTTSNFHHAMGKGGKAVGAHRIVRRRGSCILKAIESRMTVRLSTLRVERSTSREHELLGFNG